MEHDNGPAGTLFDGTQTIDTYWFGGPFHGHHHLVAHDNEKSVETRNGAQGVVWSQLGHVWDADDTWATDANTVPLTGAHWVVTRSWDFFKDTYGRKGMDNQNARIRVIGNSPSPDNAKYYFFDNRNHIQFGTSSVGNIYGMPAGINYASLDIGGHEFTHGVTRNTANFVYAGESGALDESFSDIFGTMIERFARGGTSNWTHGEDLGVAFRDLMTPSAGFFAGARTYLTDPLWINTIGCVPTSGLPPAGNDFCGVHFNSGVQNRWFYLLSQGGTQNGVAVQGIGMDKAAKIAYRNLTNFLGSNSNHPAARLGAIASAVALFGSCSNEVIQTTNAWAAVGVGAPFAGSCVTLTGERTLCPEFLPDFYNAQGLPGATFTWIFPPAWAASISGPGNKTLSITNFGNYNPPGGFPANEVITVTSSMGGSASILVTVYDDCRGLCSSSEEERSVPPILQANVKGIDADIYPNPTKTQLNVSCTGGSPRLISVFSARGDKLIEAVPTQSTLALDVSPFPNGVYFINIQFENQTVTKRFSKTN